MTASTFDPSQGLAVGMGVGHVGAERGGRLAFADTAVKALGRALADDLRGQGAEAILADIG